MVFSVIWWRWWCFEGTWQHCHMSIKLTWWFGGGNACWWLLGGEADYHSDHTAVWWYWWLCCDTWQLCNMCDNCVTIVSHVSQLCNMCHNCVIQFSGVIPFHGFSMFSAPFCYVYEVITWSYPKLQYWTCEEVSLFDLFVLFSRSRHKCTSLSEPCTLGAQL